MKNDVSLQYKGFINTENLWLGSEVYQLKQFNVESKLNDLDNVNLFKEIRLGKRVEEFVCFQLEATDNITVIAKNIQVQNGKLTIGELDALVKNSNEIIHVEIIYKFYLYDTVQDYDAPLAYWIGPNRKDSLIYKLEKLKQKQLPLLYNPLTQPILKRYNLEASKMSQQLYFKAQLFLPYHNRKKDVKPLNSGCISGWHLPFESIALLKDELFYIPKKLDWLVTPHNNITWLSYNEAITELKTSINKQRSPLCWVKDNNNDIEKCFITFW